MYYYLVCLLHNISAGVAITPDFGRMDFCFDRPAVFNNAVEYFYHHNCRIIFRLSGSSLADIVDKISLWVFKNAGDQSCEHES